jgi:hypothetical protein
VLRVEQLRQSEVAPVGELGTLLAERDELVIGLLRHAATVATSAPTSSSAMMCAMKLGRELSYDAPPGVGLAWLREH